MIVVEAFLDFENEEARDKAARDSAPVQMATRQEEPGCRAYCFAPDPCVPNRLQVYELWDDEASLVAHFKHPNYAKMVEVLRGIGITDTANQAFKVTDSMPVYQEDGSPREKFFD
ncbi:MAG: antibiotic biosynthesis monooxygenase [Alphaproteobacteria bacterium]|nr:antibiotic biosynthesis monooxygenase [Alphaproteobacteria bacterium]